MTREAAIKIIKECKEKGFKHTFYTVNEYDAALDMAINALRREDTFLGKVLEIIDEEEKRCVMNTSHEANLMRWAYGDLRRMISAFKGWKK